VSVIGDTVETSRARIDGGVAAIRGFAYQFDQTILAALDRPAEVIEVEHVEDLNGIDWCVQVKQYSGSYKPSVLTKAIVGLWHIFKLEPQRQLRLHCHFADKTAGTRLPLSVEDMPITWKNALTDGTTVAPDEEIAKFLEHLEVRFTADLETQFLIRACRQSIERIAKEGRKYGATLAIVSQRPSEISETIFSQCNNFIAMRLTNPDDQGYVRRLLPDSLGPLIEALPTLPQGDALLIGDAVVMPCQVTLQRCDPPPSSEDIRYLQEWKREWLDASFQEVSTQWLKR